MSSYVKMCNKPYHERKRRSRLVDTLTMSTLELLMGFHNFKTDQSRPHPSHGGYSFYTTRANFVNSSSISLALVFTMEMPGNHFRYICPRNWLDQDA
jgi:hypothetical protein